MFDEIVTGTDGASGAGSVGAWARVEAAACARRLAAMVGMLDARYAADGSAKRAQWCLDNWGAVCAEIGAAQQITPGAASHQLLIATALRDRLPRVGQVFAEGLVTFRLVSTIVWRTLLVRDSDPLRAVDAALASAIQGWEPMSAEKTVAAIDYWVERFDPHALRRTQESARSRCVDISPSDERGLATFWGMLGGSGLAMSAFDCDIDHTIPYPIGPTQASNLKCLCRKNHLLKTFWGGPGGWRDEQFADGTVVWTAPDGQTYTTRPGSRLLFPSLCEPTAPVVTVGRVAATHTPGLTMPRRKTTRAEARRQRIDLERELNASEAEHRPREDIPPF